MAQDPRIPAWLDTSLFPFENRFVEIDGNLVHYIDEGQGPTLLLLHGNPTWSFLYRNVVRGLAPHFRCIALDYPGFGLSQARAGYGFTPREHSAVVEQFAEALGLQAMHLMVQDWGGPIGLGFAGRRPDLFTTLYIGNTWAWPGQESKSITRFSKIAGSRFATFLILTFNAFAAWLVPDGVSRKLTKAEKAAYTKPFPTRKSRWPTAIFPKEILRSRDYLLEVKNNLAQLATKRVLLLWGDKDVGFREEERRRFEAIFPAHETVILPGARHYIQEDAPEQICEAILAFEKAQASV